MAGRAEFKNVLCIRADNMGDLLMSSPAIRALKETFNCHITLLTSSMGGVISPFIKEIDETIIANLPWIKTPQPSPPQEFEWLIKKLKEKAFDAAVIFTVYSQNPLPAALLCYLAGIPHRLAFCRENPYHLLTHWAIENEPYDFIQHQVERDLALVGHFNAGTNNKVLSIRFSENAHQLAFQKMEEKGINVSRRLLILHPGVSEAKREYPKHLWIQTGKLLRDQMDCQLVITGNKTEAGLAEEICAGIGEKSFSLAGMLSIEEWIALIHHAALVISVNTGTVHIAAATQTPVIVLYALTNPQHTPWNSISSVLRYSVSDELKSKNAVVRYVNHNIMTGHYDFPSPQAILEEAKKLWENQS